MFAIAYDSLTRISNNNNDNNSDDDKNDNDENNIDIENLNDTFYDLFMCVRPPVLHKKLSDLNSTPIHFSDKRFQTYGNSNPQS